MKVILGSQSPRRKQILSHLVEEFEVRSEYFDESFPNELDSSAVPEFLAEKKFRTLQIKLEPNEILICADTVVILNDKIIGKPTDNEDAKQILLSLSGVCHQVITGVCIGNNEEYERFSCVTEVYVKKLTEESINWYIDQYQPFDKAGSYGIQDWFGHAAIEKIIGCFYNVMGLPASMVHDRLMRYPLTGIVK